METLLWRNATQTHDWMNLEIPLRILETWLSLGLVMHADWIEGKSGRPHKISIAPDDLITYLQKLPFSENRSHSFSIGGGTERTWALTAIIFPVNEGMSIFNLTIGRDSKEKVSASLLQNFIDLYTPDMVDSAIIHADPQWTMLASGPYKSPLVTTPTFAGIFWANFLGPGHLAEFFTSKLCDIQAYRVRWYGQSGLSIISTPTLEAALTADGEKKLLRLTEMFRLAKRPTAFEGW